jgi:hypothetical protein
MQGLADDLGISLRQFYRRLNTGDAAARAKLREEVGAVYGTNFTNTINDLNDLSEVIGKSDPDLAKLCERMADKLCTWLEGCPPSKFRELHQERMTALLDVESMPDDEYNRMATDFSKLPPTPEEWAKSEALLEDLS